MNESLEKNKDSNGRQAADVLNAHTDCPACQVEMTVLERVLDDHVERGARSLAGLLEPPANP